MNNDVVNAHRLQYLEHIAATADAFESWLRANTGSNDDWPIEIKADAEGGCKLCALLMEMREALAPYRQDSTKQ